ncbi:permease [Photobacterium sp.]|uniref:permease n=1 Tax=Photobacterium sp. TaxID=660 RepID=UPI00299D6E31|nr:permease [Photobacterium sp.]MDX1302977.1 permease [Photobacterium sp.]
MLSIFTQLASWLSYSVLQLEPGSRLAEGVHFFIEDTSKIYALLFGLIYFIALARASLNVERVRDYLQGKNRFLGYILGAVFGSVTPFCSCSSIPLFMGFVSARIPLGVTMAFLLTSPLINEVAIVLLGSLLGFKFMLAYISVGLLLGVTGGILIDALKAERWLQPFLANQYSAGAETVYQDATEHKTLTLKDRHQFAKQETMMIISRIWQWVIIGVGIGAFIHGFIPQVWISENLGAGQWWSVPVASLIAIPMYTNATAIIPIMETLLTKGVPLGTTLAFCMSAVAASLPEFMMLKQVMTYRLLFVIFSYLFFAFTVVGWLFNYVVF